MHRCARRCSHIQFNLDEIHERYIYICIYIYINVYICTYIFIYIGVQEDVDTLFKPLNLDEGHKCSSMCDTTNTA